MTVIPLLVAGLLLGAAVGFAAEHSALWGERGEKWNPRSRLPDFSFAGYHRGEQALPNVPPGVSVKDFGAKGDGVTDDTQAFLAAIAKVERGAIEVPAGRYRITGLLEITRSGVVLRGAGPDKTVLVCPKPLNDIKPNWGATTTGQRTSNYSWSGGFITVRGSFGSKKLTDVTVAAKRGDRDARQLVTLDRSAHRGIDGVCARGPRRRGGLQRGRRQRQCEQRGEDACAMPHGDALSMAASVPRPY